MHDVRSLIVVILWTLVVDSFASKLTFSRSVSADSIFKTIRHVTVGECRDECQRRSRCVSAVYRRRYSLCGLASVYHTQTSMKGDILVNRVDGPPQQESHCGNQVCTNTESCIEDETGHICKVTECVKPSLVFPLYEGNIYDVTSHIMYRGRPHGVDLQLACDTDGQWTMDEMRHTNDCSDMSGPTGVYWQPILKTPIFCKLSSNGKKYMVFQQREDGSVDFFQNWSSYEVGFGYLHGEFWMGLTTIYNIISTGSFELRIDMKDFQGQRGYAQYATFSIGGPDINYVLNVGQFTGNRGDSLISRSNGMAFSTKDHDNDVYFDNCAILFHGAWWYSGCHHANLNGLYDNDGFDTGFAKNIHWSSWTGYHYSLKWTSMKMRRI